MSNYKRAAAKDEDRDEPAEPPPRKKQRANHEGPSPPSLKDHLGRFPNHILDNICSDEHLAKLTDHFHDWLAISTYLGLTGVEQPDIRDAWPHNPKNQRLEMFKTWKRKKAERATYKCLIIALQEAQNANLIDELCKIVTTATNSSIAPFRPNDSLSSADNRSITQSRRQNEHSLPLTMATTFQRETNSTFSHNVSTSPLSSTHCDTDRQSQRLVSNLPYTHDPQAAGRDSYYSRNFQVQTSPQFAHVPFLVGECYRGVEYRHPPRFSSGGSECVTHALLTNSGGKFAFQQPPSNVASLGGQPPVTVYRRGGLESPNGTTNLHRGIENHTSLTDRREELEVCGPPANKCMRLDTQQALSLKHCYPPSSRTCRLSDLETRDHTDTIIAVESQNTGVFEGVDSRQRKINASPLEQRRTNDFEGDPPQQRDSSSGRSCQGVQQRTDDFEGCDPRLRKTNASPQQQGTNDTDSEGGNLPKRRSHSRGSSSSTSTSYYQHSPFSHSPIKAATTAGALENVQSPTYHKSQHTPFASGASVQHASTDTSLQVSTLTSDQTVARSVDYESGILPSTSPTFTHCNAQSHLPYSELYGVTSRDGASVGQDSRMPHAGPIPVQSLIPYAPHSTMHFSSAAASPQHHMQTQAYKESPYTVYNRSPPQPAARTVPAVATHTSNERPPQRTAARVIPAAHHSSVSNKSPPQDRISASVIPAAPPIAIPSESLSQPAVEIVPAAPDTYRNESPPQCVLPAAPHASNESPLQPAARTIPAAPNTSNETPFIESTPQYIPRTGFQPETVGSPAFGESPLQLSMQPSPQPTAREPLPSTRTHHHQATQPSPLLVSGNPMLAAARANESPLRPSTRTRYLPPAPHLHIPPYQWSNTQQPGHHSAIPSYAPFQSPMMTYHQQIAACRPPQIPHERLHGDSAGRLMVLAAPHTAPNESSSQPTARTIPAAQRTLWRGTHQPGPTYHLANTSQCLERPHRGTPDILFATESRGVEVHSQPVRHSPLTEPSLLHCSTSTQGSNTYYEPLINQQSQPNIPLSVPCVDNSTIIPAPVMTSPRLTHSSSAGSITRRLSTSSGECPQPPKRRSKKGRKEERRKGRKRERHKDGKEVSEEERKRACNTAATQEKRERKYHSESSKSAKKTKRFKDAGISPVIVAFGTYLGTRYRTQVATSSRPDQWPPVVTNKVFKLAMVKKGKVERGKIKDKFVQLTITGKLDDILQLKVPIELKDILNSKSQAFEEEPQSSYAMDEEERRVVLIEGAPGSGKSTLCLDICQKWEAGKLFQEYAAVILVRLRDPLVQKAKCISDLLPRRDTAMSEEVATAIIEDDGKGILWILDGWDEFPSHLQQDSIIRKLIHAELTEQGPVLCRSSVIITSRPISSGNLHPLVSARIEVLGFTPVERKRYFKEALDGNTKTLKVLQDKIGENPAVESSCYLPLNAAIMLHLFLCSEDHSLPNTHYGIFSALVCNSILRHLKERMKQNVTKIVSLDHLPEIVQGPFHSLCKLAYHGVMENKLTFSEDDLSVNPENSEINTLGLLQGVESLVSTGKHVYYNFLHLSIQELLAAYHIATQLSPEEQVSKFQEMFHQDRFSAVFRFYAAITKLQTPGINSVITSIIQRKDKQLQVSLLNCLYEAQDPSLCKFVSEQLEDELDLSYTSLSSVDCLSVGYFLSSVCITTSGVFEVNLTKCSIDQEGCKFLMRGLSRYLDPHTTSTAKLDMNLSENSLTPVGVTLIAEVIQTNGVYHKLNLSAIDNRLSSFKGLDTLLIALQCDTSLVELDLNGRPVKIITEEDRSVLSQLLEKNQTLQVLNLSKWKLHDTGASYIADGLKSNNTLKSLTLRFCGITSSGMESLSLALTENTTLETLDVNSNKVGGTGAEHLGNALQRNNSLKKLNLSYCDITDKDVESLAKCLTTNKTLRELILYGKSNDGITEIGVSCLTIALESNSTLLSLRIPDHLESADMERVVNEARRRRGLPDSSMLEVKVDFD